MVVLLVMGLMEVNITLNLIKMTTLKELITAVKEKKLTRPQLEEYSDALAELYAEMLIELAEIEKKEAIFIYDSEEKTAVAKKNAWKVTPEGQREILIKRYMGACSKMISSVKSRVFRLIY